MKINDWSVVESPNGISLRHFTDKDLDYRGEICISVKEEVIHINVYVDGVDDAISSLSIPQSFLTPKERK
jgi:hypothetical protein